MMHLSQVVGAVNGQLCGEDVVVSGISINSRAECNNRMFVALKGENFDAHEFVEQARVAGAGAALLEHDVDVALPKVLVSSTHQALKDLAGWWRGQFVIPMVGVTGSVGKTTVKEMLGAIFAQIGKGVVTEGNLNNEIGVPLTLMRLSAEDQYAVVEMGMNHAGEIARLSAIARPTIAVINNAAPAHLEGLGTVEAIAHAKGEIFEGLAADGIAVINQDDEYAQLWHQLADKHRVITFALDADADISATYKIDQDCLKMSVQIKKKTLDLQLSTVGEHNVRNALAAIAVAVAANIPRDKIKTGLESYRPIAGRLNISRVGAGTLIDDSYNANPLSMRAAMQVLCTYPSHTLIVGDMAELGSAAEYEHRHLGEVAAKLGIQALLACGRYAPLVVDGFNGNGIAFDEQADLIEYATQHLKQGTILVKGSRSAQMERVVAALTESLSQRPREEN